MHGLTWVSCACALAAAPFCAMADGDEPGGDPAEPKHGYWTFFSYFDGVMTDDTKWVDGFVPTNATDVMHFQKQDDFTYLYNARLAWPAQEWTFGTLADSSPKTTFRVKCGYDKYYYFLDQLEASRAIWVQWPDYGGFGTRNSGTSHVNRVQVNSTLFIKTVGADHTMLLDEMYGLGAIEKRGPGTMVFSNPFRGGLHLAEGRVTIGWPEPEAAYVPGAAIHLDAAATDTLTWTETNGVDRLTKWEDADGTEYYAGAPFTGNKTSWFGPTASSFEVNGVPLIDFGGYTIGGSDAAPCTPGEAAGCMMDLNHYFSDNVKEMFCAFMFTSTNVTSTPLASWAKAGGTTVQAFSIAGNRLFTSYEQMMYSGVGRFNGKPMSSSGGFYEYRDGLALGVVSGSLTNGLGSRVWHVGGNAGDKTGGGMRIAEAFAYTNALTDAQRRQNNAYLLRKWHDRSATDLYPWDLDFIRLKGIDAELNVEDGCVARVRTVHAPMDDTAGATNLVKVGGGTLELDRVSTNAIVVVRGGRVKYVRETAKIAANPQPAVWPFFHCDATQGGRFFFEKDEHGNDTTNVLAWLDVRDDVTMTMTNHTKKTTKKAFYTPDGGPRGMPCVDFGGTTKTQDGARLGLTIGLKEDGSIRYTATIVEAFIVWRNKGTKDDAPLIFSDQAAVCFARDKKSLVARANSDQRSYSALWTVDGRFMNQENEFYGMGVDDWVVIRCRAPQQNYFNALAGYRDLNGGGIQVGEVIYYDRPLNDFDARQTEAYLLRKWKNMAHPDEGEDFSGSIVFGAGVSNVLDIASDRTFKGVTCSGALVKEGAGRAKVGALAGATALAMEDGAIDVVGDWSLPAAVKLTCNVVTSGTACVTSTGTLTIPSGGVLELEMAPGGVQPETGLYTVASADAVSGSFAGWHVVADTRKRALGVRVSGNSVVVSVAPSGALLIFR